MIKINKQYYINTKKLIDDNELCVRLCNRQKIKNIPDVKVSDGLKHLILDKYKFRRGIQYTKEDIEKYIDLAKKLKIELPNRSKLYSFLKNQKGQGCTKDFIEPKEALQKLEILIGQKIAGNDNEHINNDIVGICDLLLKHKIIDKTKYKNILDTINI